MIKNIFFGLGIGGLIFVLSFGYIYILKNVAKEIKAKAKDKTKIELVIADDGQEFYVLVNKNHQPIYFLKK